MPLVEYRKSSPLYNTPQTTWFLGNYVDRELYREGSDTLTVISSKYNLRPDLMSYKLYGTVDYRMTFMMLNPDLLKDPIYDFITGITIYTATLERLRSFLGG